MKKTKKLNQSIWEETNNALIWFFAAIVGAVFSTIILLVLRSIKMKKDIKEIK